MFEQRPKEFGEKAPRFWGAVSQREEMRVKSLRWQGAHVSQEQQEASDWSPGLTEGASRRQRQTVKEKGNVGSSGLLSQAELNLSEMNRCRTTERFFYFI